MGGSFFGGSPTTSNTQTNQNIQYTPYAQGNMQQVWNAAATAAATPYIGYTPGMAQNFATNTGELVAPLTQAQMMGEQGIVNAMGMGQPYINTGAGTLGAGVGMVQGAAAPISANQIQSYMDPFQQNVINATMANINNVNAQQQQQVQGNAAMQGALGGDRSAVAQSVLAGQQALAANQTLAGLQAQNYAQATGTALAEQQAGMAGGAQLGSLGAQQAGLGQLAQGTAIQGGQAAMGAGAVEQQTKQAQDTAIYQQYLQRLAYPFQKAQFLGSVGLPAAGAQGGMQTQIGQAGQVVTPPGLSPYQVAAGAGAVATGLAGSPAQTTTNPGGVKRGGRIEGYDAGGNTTTTASAPYPWQVSATDIMGGMPGSTVQLPASATPQIQTPQPQSPFPTTTAPQQSTAQPSTLSQVGNLGSIISAGQGLGKLGSSAMSGLSSFPTSLATAADSIFPGSTWSPAADLMTGSGGSMTGFGTAATDLGAAAGASAPLDLGAAAAAPAAFDALGATAAGEAGASAVADAAMLLLLKRGGGVPKYDTGGSAPYPGPDAYNFTSGPFSFGNIHGHIPAGKGLQSPQVNYGQMLLPPRGPLAVSGGSSQQDPYEALIGIQQAQAALKGMRGFADGGTANLSPDFTVGNALAQQAAGAMPLSTLDQAQILQEEKSKLGPISQTMQPSFAARGGEIEGYDDGGSTDDPNLGYYDLGDLWGKVKGAASNIASDIAGLGAGVGRDYAPTPSPSPVPVSTNQPYPVYGPAQSQGGPDLPVPLPPSRPPPTPPPPPTAALPPAAAPVSAGPYTPRVAAPAAGQDQIPSWNAIMNPQTFANSIPQRQTVAQMFSKPDAFTRLGINILSADPRRGPAGAIGQGLATTVGEYDKWPQENLSAEQKAQVLASKIKEHLTMTPYESGRLGIEGQNLALRRQVAGESTKWQSELDRRINSMIKALPPGQQPNYDELRTRALAQMPPVARAYLSVAPAAASASAPTLPDRPSGVDPSAGYSPSTGMWVSRDGHMWNSKGDQVR